MSGDQRATSTPGFFKRVAFVTITTALTLLAVEGLASWIVVGRIAWDRLDPIAERMHTRYDAELGWVNVPSLSVPDMYGPGIALRTNAQGFRNDREFPPAIPAGRVRIVCSGDSFTLGYGVSNDQAWCNRLAVIDSRIEPVNMGQGGYGIDQAYLWYRRDGTKIAHDVQLFAFNNIDFQRMGADRFLGYPKPVLALDHGRLAVHNVPVPYRSTTLVKLGEMERTLASFRTVQLIRSLTPGSQGSAPVAPANGSDADPLRPVVEQVFESLRDMHAQRGSLLVLVFLPLREDYDGHGSDAWRAFVRDAAARLGVPLIDLVGELRSVPAGEVESLFIKAGDVPYGHAEGHYTVRGNQFIAASLHQGLCAIESLAAKLCGVTPAGRRPPSLP